MSSDDHLGFSAVPARRRRLEAEAAPATAATPPEFDDADLARGQAAAVLGVLGRLQLRLDVLAREQAEGVARIEARLRAIEARLSPLQDDAASSRGTDHSPGE